MLAVWETFKEPPIGLGYKANFVGKLLHLPALGAGKVYCHRTTP
jgi:hypothetical protein